MTGPDRWLRLPPDPGAASLTLVCVPHAGAGASSFARWPVRFGPDVRVARVQLPGREDVSDEPLLQRVDDVVAGLGPGLVRLSRRGPLALYGHSMGALVAYELARALTAVGLSPTHLAVSGRRAPHLPARHPLLHHLPDDELLAGLDAMAATPDGPAPPPRTPAQIRYALRVTRADLALGEEYRHATRPLLSCPVSAFGGLDDPVVAADEVDAWHAVTTGPFRARLLPGGHFFHQRSRDAIADALRPGRVRAEEVETGVARPA